MASLQPVHDRPFHLRKMQRHASILEPVIDPFQAFQSAGINAVYSRAHQNKVFQVRPVADDAIDRVFQEAGIGEVEAFIDPDGQHLVGRYDGMPVHIAEVMCPGNLAHNGKVRPAGIVEVQQQREGDPGRHAQLDPETKGHQDRAAHRGKVGFRQPPDLDDLAHIHKRQYGYDDGRGKDGLRQVKEIRCQEQRREGYADGCERTCGRRFGPGIEVDG